MVGRRRFGPGERGLPHNVAFVALGAALTPVADATPARSAVSATATTTPTTPLRILVTNDDGVAAPGLATLVDALQSLPDVQVTVIAPVTSRSMARHAMKIAAEICVYTNDQLTVESLDSVA